MNRSISVVEYKVQQTEFFLNRLSESGSNMFAVQCFTDAFANSARTITFSIQAVVGKVDGFEEWYKERQERLKQDALAQFFKEYRNVSSKIGETCVRGGSFWKGPNSELNQLYYFGTIPDLDKVPITDVFEACLKYFKTLLQIVYEAFSDFKYELDDRWYFTAENFHRNRRNIDDALIEIGFPAGWLGSTDLISEKEQWLTLRKTQTVGCQINSQFSKYLGSTIVGPDE